MPGKILVVEDNFDSRNLLNFIFMARGFDVVIARDGLEGLFLARQEKPDFIITDLSMPVMSGTELIEQIRAEPEIAAIPIVTYTAFGKTISDEASRAGANEVFTKPFDLKAMIEFVTDSLHSQLNN